MRHPAIEVQVPPASAQVLGLGCGAGVTQHSPGASLNRQPARLSAVTVPPCFAHVPCSVQIPPAFSQATACGSVLPPPVPPWPLAPPADWPAVPLLPPRPPAPPGMQHAAPTPEPQDRDKFMVPEAQLPGKTPTQVPPASVQVLIGTDVLPPVPLPPPVPLLPPDPLLPPRPLLLPVPPLPPAMQQIEPIPEPQDKEDTVPADQLPGATATHNPPASVQALANCDVLPPVPLLPPAPVPPVPLLPPVPLTVSLVGTSFPAASCPPDLPASVLPGRAVLLQPVRK